MAAFTWVMMGLAVWHFTIFLPDRCWGGIVGAFLGALFGSVLFALAINGFSVPSRDETDILTTLQGIPGAVIGIAAMYFEGSRREKADAARASPVGV